MEEQYKNKSITPEIKDRLKAFWRMKYHPQLMNLENRALFYAMKDLESLPELSNEQEDMLFALQKRFNCLPYITMQQIGYMRQLEDDLEAGIPITPSQEKDLARLRQLPLPDIPESDILGLTAPECKEYKQLKARRDKGDQMDPEDIKRYKDLKDKIKRAKEEEEKANKMQTPPQKEMSPDP